MSFITNFSAKDLSIYEEAIKRYQLIDKSIQFRISASEAVIPEDKSLHVENAPIDLDLTDFWSTFVEVEDERRKETKS